MTTFFISKHFRWDAEARFRARIKLGEVHRDVTSPELWQHHGVPALASAQLAKIATLMRHLHDAVDQKRKYTGQPYYIHPMMVAELYAIALPTHYMGVAAALLHDVLEDVSHEGFIKVANEVYGLGPLAYDGFTKDELLVMLLQEHVSDVVAEIIYHGVLEVTDVSKPEDGNRATRKRIDNDALASRSLPGRLRKLCDLIGNTESIMLHDEDFGRVYRHEKQQLMNTPGFLDGLEKLYVTEIARLNTVC